MKFNITYESSHFWLKWFFGARNSKKALSQDYQVTILFRNRNSIPMEAKNAIFLLRMER